MIVCYLVGFATHGLIYWVFEHLANVFGPLKRYHSDYGYFEKGLFDCRYRDDSEDFGPYTNEFVKNLKAKIENVFRIEVGTVQEEAKKAGNNIKYTEIFGSVSNYCPKTESGSLFAWFCVAGSI